MTLSKVGIKGNRTVKFRERALMFASPQQHVAERQMAYRVLIANNASIVDWRQFSRRTLSAIRA